MMNAFIIGLLLLCIVLVNLRRNGKDSKNLPPSPARLPIIGNLHQVGRLPHRTLQALADKYGPLMLLHFGSFPALVVSSAEAAREIMKNQDLIFADRYRMILADKVLYGSRDLIFAPYGEYWRRMKSICVLHLLSNKKVQSFGKVREEETSIMIAKITENGSSTVNLSDMITSLISNVVCRVVLGRKFDKDDEQGRLLKRAIKNLSQIVGYVNVEDFIPWLGWINTINGTNSKVDQICKGLDQLLEVILRERREKRRKNEQHYEVEEASNFVDILLDFQEGSVNSSTIDDFSIKAIILDMFLAGTDTTSVSLKWAMAELLKNPTWMKILKNEVRSIINAKDEKRITEEDVDRMPYMEAVLKEAMRLHLALPFLIPRESTQPTKIMGYDIPAHTRIMINAWWLANDPKVWEDPQTFNPERFLGDVAKNSDFKGFNNFDYIPFGSGRRSCPGIGFSMAAMKLAVANLVYHFDFSLGDGVTEHDLDMSESGGVTNDMKFPILVVAHRCD